MGKVVQRLKLRWTGETELIPTSGRVSRVPPASNVLRQFIVRPLRVACCLRTSAGAATATRHTADRRMLTADRQ